MAEDPVGMGAYCRESNWFESHECLDGDHVGCLNCYWAGHVERGGEVCPNCNANGNLVWSDAVWDNEKHRNAALAVLKKAGVA